MAEVGEERFISKIEVRVPLEPPINFGQGPKDTYTVGWQIPDQADVNDRLIPVMTRRHRQVREAVARLSDTRSFRFYSSGYYESVSGGQSGISFRRRGRYSSKSRRAA